MTIDKDPDAPMPSADDHARITRIREHFLRLSDRADKHSPNPLFAGRDELVASVLDDADRLSRFGHPTPNLTTVLYGAPGAGKTETLNHLRGRLRAMSTDERPIWPIDAGAGDLSEALVFAETLEEHFKRGWIAWAKDRQKRGAGFNIAGLIGASVGPDVKGGPRDETARLRRFVRELNVKVGRKPTVVLLVDEAQRKLHAVADRTGADNFVGAFHDAEIDLKVLPVYAGLGHTPDELRRCGVSRLELKRVHLLEGLSEKTVKEVAAEGLGAFAGRDDGESDIWTDRIVDAVQGWPKHLSNTLGTVANVARANGWTLDRNGFDRAMNEARKARAQYYEDRLKATDGALETDRYRAWAALCRRTHPATGETLPVTDRAIASALGVDRDEARSIRSKAVQAGLLEERAAGRYIAPIPSLVAHIADAGREHDADEESLGPT